MYYFVLPEHKQLRAENGFFRFKESFMVPWRSLKMTKDSSYDNYEALKDSEFIYFTLHVDPEASTMHLSPEFTDQVAVIELLAKRRPLHMNIMVKEHPNMIGRRPPGFYEAIRRLPGVYLINPAIASRELVKRAKLVFTITGTVAWEAIVLQKPAVMLGHFPFLPFATKVGKGLRLAKVDTLADDIQEGLKLKPVPDEELQRFLSLLFEQSFSLSSQLFWGEVSDEIVVQNITMVQDMAAQFMKRHEEHEAVRGSNSKTPRASAA